MQDNAFKVRQASTLKPHDLWDWEMWLEPARSNVTLKDVSRVTYGLHSCFPNPNRVIRNGDDSFRLRMRADVAEEQTWGHFPVRVTIVMRDGRREVQNVPLALSFPADPAKPVPQLMPLPKGADYFTARRYYGLLKAKSAFGYAHEVLVHAASVLNGATPPPGEKDWAKGQRNWIAQQRALCTYKDPSQVSNTRLNKALDILREAGDISLAACKDPETLGLCGAIYKRLWETNGRRAHLECALAYYRSGYELQLARRNEPNVEKDSKFDAGAFTGANVMFLSDALALEIPKEVDVSARNRHIGEADRVRRQLVSDLPPLQQHRQDDWWIAVTLLDALFGLACEDASFDDKLIAQADYISKIDPSPWERQSTGLQLLRSARLMRDHGRGSAEQIDKRLNDTFTVAFRGLVNTKQARFDGKLGLALSGGGFRASLFHIGVLARLAELDLLRYAEVISCVSGGSIVGAHYYLLLRDLLQKTPDAQITRDDYVELVRKLLDQFLAGVQKNIRMHVAASWIANVRMIFQTDAYSRTQRLGRLYEKYLYKLVDDGEQDQPRWLNEAFVVPKRDESSWEDSFSPKLDNWRRAAKVPMLVLNATTLNTGRNWQFTASSMGEPLGYGTTVDSTERLETVYYNDACENFRQYRLGDAVAASSCVPALFTPIVLQDLFKGRTVRLVDGGVHDNQGTRALLDQDCDSIIVSDASGQMGTEPNPPHGEVGVILRTNSVLQARIRVAQHQELESRARSGILRRAAYLHLRKDIESTVQQAMVPEPAGGDEAAAPGEARGARTGKPVLAGVTSYGIDRGIQSALASVRTDLDSFTDREAFALMLSGYQMARNQLGEFPTGPDVTSEQWPFMRVADAARGDETGASGITASSLRRHIEAGSRLAFKIWHLHPVLNGIRLVFLWGVGLAVAGALLWLAFGDPPLEPARFSVDLEKLARKVVFFGATAGAIMLFPWAKKLIKGAKQAMNPGSALGRIAFGVVMALVGSIVCRLHLWLFDWIFLRAGRVKRV